MRSSNILDLVELSPLMKLSSGRPEVVIGLIDGPVARNHPDIDATHIQELAGSIASTCSRPASFACTHGTFVAGILSAKRTSVAPAICPSCTLLVRPIFAEQGLEKHPIPNASPEELATAIIETIKAGAKVVNMSVGLERPSLLGHHALKDALDYAWRHGVILVAAAGNQATVGGSELVRHHGVIPVVAFNRSGHPMSLSNLGCAIGKNGVGAPGEDIISLSSTGNTAKFGGTSAATPFIAGAIALLWSLFPSASMTQIKLAITRVSSKRRRTIVPPLLNAWKSFKILQSTYGLKVTA